MAVVALVLAAALFAQKGETNQPATVSKETIPAKQVAGTNVPVAAVDPKRFEAGKTAYEGVCLACHQQNGQGQEGLAPPLAGSEWVAGTPERLVRIVLSGLNGPVHVKNQTFEIEMPSLGVLEDEQIADVLTYIRREWGHNFSSVATADVKRIRAATEKRDTAWTEEELKKIE